MDIDTDIDRHVAFRATVEEFKENEMLNFPDIIRKESQSLREIVILDIIYYWSL